MGEVSVAIAGLCYLHAAYCYARQGDWSMFIVFLAYAAANAGLIMKGLGCGENQ